jgi:hypothetical protein
VGCPFCISGLCLERSAPCYRGIDDALVDSVTAADLRWAGDLLARLSEDRWQDAFRAGGYTPDERVRYVRKIQEKIAQAVGETPPASAPSVGE